MDIDWDDWHSVACVALWPITATIGLWMVIGVTIFRGLGYLARLVERKEE
jgi:hypothetical protein